MRRLLLISDSPTIPTGYANIVRWFADALYGKRIDVAFGAFQHPGLPLIYRFNGREYPHYGCNPPHRITDAINDFDPDLILHVRDIVAQIPRLFPGAYSVKDQAHGRPVWGWIPVQHETIPWEYVQALHKEYDTILTFTAAGAELLGNCGVVRDRLKPLTPGISPSFAEPEGVVAEGYGREKVPIVMSVGLGHQDRKCFPALMRAYREVQESIDLDFYLHTASLAAFDLREHARMLGVTGHWLFPRGYDPGIGYSEENMAMRYRRALAYVSLGTGEGLDMPLMEAAAMGKVVIYPAEPNRIEVVSDYQGLKMAYQTAPVPRTNNWEHLPDPHSLAQCLLQLRDLVPTTDLGRNYYAEHTWKKCAERFLAIVEDRGL